MDGEHNRSRGKVAQRREHAVEFASAIGAFNAAAQHAGAADSAGADGAGQGAAGTAGRIRVAVRKRPLFPHESAKGDFDTVCCAPGGVWMHRTMMRADLKHMVLESYDFAFPDGVFSEQQDTDAVFADAVAPLVSTATSRGGVSTIMCFGQTGSGKTYTTNGLSERVAERVFATLPPGSTAGVVCVEVAGAKVRDLLGGGAPVTLLEDSVGVVHTKGAVEVPTADAAALRTALADAQAGRAAAATGVHDASSRSHSVSRVILHDEAGAEFGRIDLVDLAGSEWAADREQHSTERQREGAEINSSLMCLKACMRTAMSADGTDVGRMPYRQHALTKLLKDGFMGESVAGCEPSSLSRTLLLATLSPSSADTEHSLSTLQHVAAIANSNSKAAAAASGSGGGGVGGSAGGDDGDTAGGTVLQTEASKAARQVLTTNVPQAQEMIRTMEAAAAAQADGQDDVPGLSSGSADGEGWEALNPIDWSSGDVAVWWTAAASRAVAQINQAVAQAEAEATAVVAEPEVAAVAPTAEETLQLVLEQSAGGDGPLGLAFVKAAATGSEEGLPVVSGVKDGSAVGAALSSGGGMTGGLKGWRLLGVSTTAAAQLSSAAGLHPAAALRKPTRNIVLPAGASAATHLVADCI